MKTNFQEWLNHYGVELSRYYDDFSQMFPSEKETPSFLEFARYCFRNSYQDYNHSERRYEARIY